MIFEGSLSGLNEVPQNNSAGTGFVRVTIDDHDSTMRVQANFSGLTGTTTAAHIHIGNGPGTNGGVATQLPSFTGFPLGVTAGTMDRTFDMNQSGSWNASYITNNGGTTATAFSAFATALVNGRGYFNIHSTQNPGGELRANLVLVPEPATLTFLALGAAAMIRRRKKA